MDQASKIFSQVVEGRRSVRGFKAEPVAQDLIEDVFRIAQQAPSNCNTQPWDVVVVSGEKCDLLRTRFTEAFMQGQIKLDFPYDGKYEGVYRDRQYDSANQLYSAQSIDRADKVRRNEAFMRNFTFFEAPHVAFFFLPEPFGLREAADLGMYAQTVMLSMVANGLASCPQTALSMSADMLREELDLPSSMKVMFGLSFGYEDLDHPANNCRVGRADVADTVKFIN
ncbi:MAG: nitroreductase [Pseudomonadales bacterium]